PASAARPAGATRRAPESGRDRRYAGVPPSRARQGARAPPCVRGRAAAARRTSRCAARVRPGRAGSRARARVARDSAACSVASCGRAAPLADAEVALEEADPLRERLDRRAAPHELVLLAVAVRHEGRRGGLQGVPPGVELTADRPAYLVRVMQHELGVAAAV